MRENIKILCYNKKKSNYDQTDLDTSVFNSRKWTVTFSSNITEDKKLPESFWL